MSSKVSHINLRVFNVPNSKTKNGLELEFSRLDVPILNITLPMRSDNVNAGYAVVEFENDENKNAFVQHFSVLRRDLVIYKPIQ